MLSFGLVCFKGGPILESRILHGACKFPTLPALSAALSVAASSSPTGKPNSRCNGVMGALCSLNNSRSLCSTSQVIGYSTLQECPQAGCLRMKQVSTRSPPNRCAYQIRRGCKFRARPSKATAWRDKQGPRIVLDRWLHLRHALVVDPARLC